MELQDKDEEIKKFKEVIEKKTKICILQSDYKALKQIKIEELEELVLDLQDHNKNLAVKKDNFEERMEKFKRRI